MKHFLIDNSPELAKVDISDDFREHPPLFESPDDIIDFINQFKIETVPILKVLLQLWKSKKLVTEHEYTETELNFILSETFDYIYDVYRVPVEKTYSGVIKWLEYIESNLLSGGLSLLSKLAYSSIDSNWETTRSIDEFMEEHKIDTNRHRHRKLLNYYTDIGLPPENLKYYTRDGADVVEQFWIKTTYSGQPEVVGYEAYMRVIVYNTNKVYIFGCDDCSYTLESNDKDEIESFVKKLKYAAPIWDFMFKEFIHRKLEFTN
jgi:hypothetical protein